LQDLRKLSVYFYDFSGLSYTNRTDESFGYDRDSYTIALETADFLYIGRDKPFNALYAEVSSANAVSTSLAATYYDGTTWTSLPLLVENTKAFQRSGFIKWVLPYSGSSLLWEESTVNSVSKYWMRLAVGSTLTGTTALQGLNIVFSDDQDLKAEDRAILAMLPRDENDSRVTTHILSHVAARESIVDALRLKGHYKTLDLSAGSQDEGHAEGVDEWDILDIGQVRQASTYKALSKIYYQASDSVDDIHYAKAKDYDGLYKQSLDLFLLTLDANDDGEASGSEKSSTLQGGIFTRR
jgi:hypothetical protein